MNMLPRAEENCISKGQIERNNYEYMFSKGSSISRRNMGAKIRSKRYLVSELVEKIVRMDVGEITSFKDVADILCVSQRTLGRYLENEGMTFREISLKVRISTAKKLLRCSSISVSNVGQRIGYSDPSNFTKAFKKATGMTPRYYRHQSK